MKWNFFGKKRKAQREKTEEAIRFAEEHNMANMPGLTAEQLERIQGGYDELTKCLCKYKPAGWEIAAFIGFMIEVIRTDEDEDGEAIFTYLKDRHQNYLKMDRHFNQ